MTPLIELAAVIRSKNAGPFELTLDVIFRDRSAFEQALDGGQLTAAAIARAYQLPPERVLSLVWFEPALAFKATLRREVCSGAVGDSDVFGAQQHAPLLELRC